MFSLFITVLALCLLVRSQSEKQKDDSDTCGVPEWRGAHYMLAAERVSISLGLWGSARSAPQLCSLTIASGNIHVVLD
jgi:hypothetical protein